MAGDSGRVYSLEADDFVFDILTKNIEANERSSAIVPVFGAVHNTVGETLHFPVQDFKRFQSYGSYGIDYNGGPGRPVKTFTIDSWCVATRTANRNRSTLQNLTTDCPDRSKFSASTNRLGDLCKKTKNSPIRAIDVSRGSPDP